MTSSKFLLEKKNIKCDFQESGDAYPILSREEINNYSSTKSFSEKDQGSFPPNTNDGRSKSKHPRKNYHSILMSMIWYKNKLREKVSKLAKNILKPSPEK